LQYTQLYITVTSMIKSDYHEIIQFQIQNRLERVFLLFDLWSSSENACTLPQKGGWINKKGKMTVIAIIFFRKERC
jgi:hypothetical protein